MGRPGQKSCDRCGDRAKYFVVPYYDKTKGFCSRCCFELNHLHDKEGWPDGAKTDEVPEGRKVLRPGPTYNGSPIAVDPRSA